MQKVIFGIFAHPDDEAFGPGGTLIKETRNGNDVHLITLTAGEAGNNPKNHSDLASIRLNEWHESGSIIGAKSMHFLGFEDGKLNNQSMVIAQQKINDIIIEILKKYSSDIEIEFMTIDLNGVTGHIDHIVAARASSFVFYTLKEMGYPMQKIRYACLPQRHLKCIDTGWIFMERGRLDSEISEIIDVSEYEEDIVRAISAHHTQSVDATKHLSSKDNYLVNHFIIRNADYC